ncbi:hypothetical protein [Thermoanaerobacter kivui]|nr:hypothetical protein [Thermoanaerobacter kivui]
MEKVGRSKTDIYVQFRSIKGGEEHMVLKRNKLYEVRELIEALDNVIPYLEKEIENRKKAYQHMEK